MNPAGRGGELRSITCVSEGAEWAWYRRGVNRRDGRGHRAGEAVQLLAAGGTQSLRYRERDPHRRSACERHDPTGEPDAGNPHVQFGGQGVETDLWEPD